MTVEEADARTNMLPSGENGSRLGPHAPERGGRSTATN